MIVLIERTDPFPRETVHAWWTDFREDNHHGSDWESPEADEGVRTFS